MEEQGSNSIPDLSISLSNESLDQTSMDFLWAAQAAVNYGNSFEKSFGASVMSEEEQKIRAELEIEVERDLEREIKDGIYHLALRLHRLYQNQKDRNARYPSTAGAELQSEMKSKTFTEVNITIRMEGGSKVEMFESKKGIGKKDPVQHFQSDDKQRRISSGEREFNWARTLRSGTGSSVSMNKRQEIYNQDRVSRNKINIDCNGRHGIRDRKKISSSPKQVKDTKLLELGWIN